jgi:hypothetical protein
LGLQRVVSAFRREYQSNPASPWLCEFYSVMSCDSNALASSQQPNLGLKIGSSEGLISMGILGFAMQSCKTVADALEIALRYHQVSGSVLNLNFTIAEESVELEFIENITPTNLKIFFCDELLSSIMACFNAMLGDHQDIILLELSYSPTTHLAEYQKILPVRFGLMQTEMSFDLNEVC